MTKRTATTIVSGLLALLLGGSVAAGLAAAPEETIFKAMTDELGRSTEKLAMENLDRPYYIAYRIRAGELLDIYASFGSLLSSELDHVSVFYPEVRVGSATLDNTNFVGGSSFMGGRRGFMNMEMLPVEPEYDTLRWKLWLGTDEAYKQALKALSQKRGYLLDRTLEQQPPDFSPAAPYVYDEGPAAFPFQREKWETLARELSAIFRNYPVIDDSQVEIHA
jgi:TldD protein